MAMMMIGVDEAGYGPNLGPLTIAGTVWQVEDGGTDLYKQLQAIVDKSPQSDGKRIAIADSKQIHQTDNLKFLEQPVLAILKTVWGELPQTWDAFVSRIVPEIQFNAISRHCWLQDVEIPFPVAADRSQIERLGERFGRACDRKKIKLAQATCCPVFADEFNHLIREENTPNWNGLETNENFFLPSSATEAVVPVEPELCVGSELSLGRNANCLLIRGLGNKADLLSTKTLQLVRVLLDRIGPTSPIQIGCDKHGGRGKYAALIQEHLTPEFVSVRKETREQSEYRFRERGCDITMQFTARGESFLPTALSSMIAKYVREVFMIAWNQFWQQHLPDLKPTKGYPGDSKRFLRDIDAVRERLEIPLESIWRFR
jgi:ribonuclease HII